MGVSCIYQLIGEKIIFSSNCKNLTATSKGKSLVFLSAIVGGHSYLPFFLLSFHFELPPFSSTWNSFLTLFRFLEKSCQSLNVSGQILITFQNYGQQTTSILHSWTFPLSEPGHATSTYVERIHKNKREYVGYFQHHHFYPGFVMMKREI